MYSNALPHLSLPDDGELVAGGGLKDGWSYLMPSDDTMLYEEVSTAFADELEDHVKEQTEALKNLYLPSSTRGSLLHRKSSNMLEALNASPLSLNETRTNDGINFIVQRGHQVLAFAVLNQEMRLLDIVMVPSAKHTACKALLDAVKVRVKELNSSLFYVELSDKNDLELFKENGCEMNGESMNYGAVLLSCSVDSR
jgi:hypothetical protein